MPRCENLVDEIAPGYCWQDNDALALESIRKLTRSPDRRTPSFGGTTISWPTGRADFSGGIRAGIPALKGHEAGSASPDPASRANQQTPYDPL